MKLWLSVVVGTALGVLVSALGFPLLGVLLAACAAASLPVVLADAATDFELVSVQPFADGISIVQVLMKRSRVLPARSEVFVRSEHSLTGSHQIRWTHSATKKSPEVWLLPLLEQAYQGHLMVERAHAQLDRAVLDD